jgi:hypothetical protein
MIWSTPALQDTTIFESDPYRNAGMDQVLELQKLGDTTTDDLTESRILIKFDLSTLNSVLTENNITINDVSASLKLYTVQEFELPQTYTLEAKALAAPWLGGTGLNTLPSGTQNSASITDGATWISTSGISSTEWSSINTSGTAIKYNQVSGGGAWHTASIASQSFSFKSNDYIDFNVSNIVKNWQNNVYSNNGFQVSFKHNEITASNYPQTLIQLYSSDTHTVYEPHLYISWTGSITYNTGSITALAYEDEPIIYVRSFRGEYTKDTKARILIGTRPKYPRPTFTQNSIFAVQKALPKESYYQIKDAHNNNIIIPYSNSTKINTNTSGSYFDFYTTMLYPERFYKFEVKAIFDGITEYFNANEFTFKIIK